MTRPGSGAATTITTSRPRPVSATPAVTTTSPAPLATAPTFATATSFTFTTAPTPLVALAPAALLSLLSPLLLLAPLQLHTLLLPHHSLFLSFLHLALTLGLSFLHLLNQLLQLLTDDDESKMQLAAKVVSQSPIIVVDTKVG